MTSVFSPLKKKDKSYLSEKFNANPKSSISLLEVHDVDAEDLNVELRYRFGMQESGFKSQNY